MTAMEKLGMTEERFKTLYKQHNGFSEFNKNHPEHAQGETFWDYLARGSRNFAKDHTEIVTDIIHGEE